MKVEYVTHMGDDLMVANTARVSFAKENAVFTTRGEKETGSDEGLIEYLAKHKHWCYDDQTEVFTDRGWVNFGDISYNDRVAQVSGWGSNDFRFSFTNPEKIHRTYYEGIMYEANGSKISYSVTPHHKMLFMGRDKKGLKGYWEIGNSDKVFGKYKKFRLSAKLEGETNRQRLDEGRLLGFLLGDGFYKGSGVCVRLKRNRKIQYLEDLLGRLKISYTTAVKKDQVMEFSIKTETNLYKDGEKYLDFPKAVSMGISYCQGLFEGLLNSDGSVKRNTHTFSSSSRNLMDSFIDLATVCGKNAIENKPKHGKGKHRLNYRAMVQTRNTTIVSKTKGGATENKTFYKGYVGCVTVPTGMLLVRRGGLQMVCGNTPFGHPNITLKCSAPVPIRTQCFKHKVGFVENEESRRYISNTPEIHVPTEFRMKPTGGAKQGSEGVHPDTTMWRRIYQLQVDRALRVYCQMITDGICPEQARFILPQGAVVNWIWTGSLMAYARFYGLRADSHAQKEVQEMAKQVGEIIQPLFPYSWKALTKGL